MYSIRENLSPRIIKSFILLFLVIAVVNSVTFGVAEYRYMKKLIKKEFTNIVHTIDRPLGDAIWRGDKKDINGILDGLMRNYHITAIKIINFEDQTIAYEREKGHRGAAFFKSSEIKYTYNNRTIKVAKIKIYSDRTAVVYRSKKVFMSKTSAMARSKEFCSALKSGVQFSEVIKCSTLW